MLFRSRAVGERVEVRPVLPIGATLDHRLLDGFQIGKLAARFRAVLEDPAGNKIGRAFEVLPSDPSSLGASADVVTVPFQIK